ncbi:hypothetical protein [Thermomonospora cellulosilytica]|uniref:Uncharacterized protein n=1 Tax=Thermomonospora cellulosilytica TaxID=1411118 RepID=A0A7W3N1T4_9ACTN|nr:hypothetical protein [Thermomonospora cellulosilytica]MBA9005964.1 hypothetical protein [Thermomonospora cellulosilytica]
MSASKAQQAATAERRRKAIAMRIAGVDWQSIADQLGYASRGAACTDVTRALKANRRAEAQEVELLRDIEGQRLDRLQAAYWAPALKGDHRSAEVILRVMAQRARLEGLEAPTRVSVEAQQLGDEILELLGVSRPHNDGDAGDGDGGDVEPES